MPRLPSPTPKVATTAVAITRIPSLNLPQPAFDTTGAAKPTTVEPPNLSKIQPSLNKSEGSAGAALVTIPPNSGVKARIISIEPAPERKTAVSTPHQQTAFEYMSKLNQEMPVKIPLSETLKALAANPAQKAEMAVCALPGVIAGVVVETVRKVTK